jgi:hypothetical protein
MVSHAVARDVHPKSEITFLRNVISLYLLV